MPDEMVPAKYNCRAVILTAALPVETEYPVPTSKEPTPLQSLSATTVRALPYVVAEDDVDRETESIDVSDIAPFDVI